MKGVKDIRLFQKRLYRNLIDPHRLVSFSVRVNETDLRVHAGRHLEDQAKESVLRQRGIIESYAQRHPDFVRTLAPLRIPGPAPMIIREMAEAGCRAGVGPMAAVAGAIAEHVGKALLAHTDEVIVENGGDFYQAKRSRDSRNFCRKISAQPQGGAASRCRQGSGFRMHFIRTHRSFVKFGARPMPSVWLHRSALWRMRRQLQSETGWQPGQAF